MLATVPTGYRWFLILSLLLVVSCSKKADFNQSESSPTADARPDAAKSNARSQEKGTYSANLSSESAPTSQPEVQQHRMIVRNGEITLSSSDHEQTMHEITNIVSKCGGYVSNESTRHTEYHTIESELTVRIPANRFDSALAAIKKTGSEVTYENITAEDQTKEYYDLERHTASKKAELEQLDQLLRTAKKLDDILTIKSEIRDIESELDDLQASTKQIESEVLYSKLHIEIRSQTDDGFFARIGRSIGKGASSFTDVLTDTITFLIAGIPVFAVLIAFIYLVIWMARRPARKKRDAEANP
jgi:hypothetical protein